MGQREEHHQHQGVDGGEGQHGIPFAPRKMVKILQADSPEVLGWAKEWVEVSI
jgi:hypothetical protein